MGRALSTEAAPAWAGLSLWHRTADDDWAPRPSLPGDTDADVVVVGAGFTGLWTAYYLLEADPTLRVVVLEAETAGFGASGRNGGWCSALFPASLAKTAALPGSSRADALALHRAMRATVDEVLAVAAAEGIDAQAHKGGTISVARTAAQLRRAREEVDAARSWGRGEDDVRLLDRDQARARLDAAGTLGGTFTPDCAAIHPARLVRGLAAGGRAARRADPRADPGAAHRARPGGDRPRRRCAPTWWCGPPRATPGRSTAQGRAVVPVYSLIVATEPLPDETWDRIGLRERETFTDHRNLIVYGQRTADGRLVFGGRGRAVPLRVARSGPASTASRGSSTCCAGRSWRCSRPSLARGSPTPGAARWASPATGSPPSDWTGAPGWPGRAATSATASVRRTWPAGRCATWCSVGTPS